jgi:hypothetical protein
VSRYTFEWQAKLAEKKRYKPRFYRTILPFATETSLPRAGSLGSAPKAGISVIAAAAKTGASLDATSSARLGCRIMARTAVAAARRFGSNRGYTGHTSDIVDTTLLMWWTAPAPGIEVP